MEIKGLMLKPVWVESIARWKKFRGRMPKFFSQLNAIERPGRLPEGRLCPAHRSPMQYAAGQARPRRTREMITMPPVPITTGTDFET